MKIKSILSLLALILCIGNTAPALAYRPNYKNTLKTKTSEIEVKNFNGIVTGGPIKVIVKLGNTESCRFEGDEEAISTLIAEVTGKTLIIRPQNSWKSWERKYEGKKIIAYVTAKKLDAITMSGSGSITVENQIENSSLAITLSGSGSVKVNALTDNLTTIMSGSGSINIDGTAHKADVNISGSGSFNGKSFKVSDLSARMSGSGIIYITAENKINAFISGSGNILYAGAATVDKTVFGAGTVKRVK